MLCIISYFLCMIAFGIPFALLAFLAFMRWRKFQQWQQTPYLPEVNFFKPYYEALNDARETEGFVTVMKRLEQSKRITNEEKIQKAEKRRRSLVNYINLYLTKSYHSLQPVADNTALNSLYNKFKRNRLKYFFDITTSIAFMLVAITATANIKESEAYQQAEKNYKLKNYPTALNFYTLAFDAVKNDREKAILYYKRGLCFAQLKNCDSLKSNFQQAYLLDNEKGGASDIIKLEEKLKKCRLTLQDISGNTTTATTEPTNNSHEYQPVYSTKETETVQAEEDNSSYAAIGFFIFGIIGGVVLYAIVYFVIKAKESTHRKNAVEHAFALFNGDYYWLELAEKGYAKADIEVFKNLVSRAGKKINNLYKDSFGALLIQFKENPQLFFNPTPEQVQYKQALLTAVHDSYFCFFTAQPLLAEDSCVLAIVVQSGSRKSVRFVWTTSKIIRQIEVQRKEPKVRLHQVNGVFTHWSNDSSFYKNYFYPSENEAMMEKWQGEPRYTDFVKFHEIATNFPPNYICPSPECYPICTITFAAPDDGKNTGFERPVDALPPTTDGLDTVIIVQDHYHSSHRSYNESDIS